VEGSGEKLNAHAEAHEMRIGELLTAAEVITPRDLLEAITLGRASGLPIGRVLIMAGFISELDFRAAVQVQSMVRDSIIPIKLGIESLALACRESIILDAALARLGWNDTGDNQTNKLGELLLTSEVINLEALENAMRTCQATGLPLGRVFVALGLVSDELLATALNAQTLVREKRITRGQAINGLKAAKARRLPVEEMLKKQGFFRGAQPRFIRLGQLFNDAKVVSDEQLWAALSESFISQQFLGQTLLQMKLVNERQLENALLIQEMVANQSLTFSQSVETLRIICNTQRTLANVLAYLEVPEEKFKTTVRFHDVLRVCGLINNEVVDLLQIEHRTKPSSKDAFQTAETLLTNKVLDERLSEGALRCYFLIASGWLNIQQGIVALNYLKNRKVGFDGVLDELRWTIKTFVRGNEALAPRT
jgi:hypothetical protein